MKISAIVFTFCLLGTTAAQADVINRRNQCDRWEYIPASETLGSTETALLFCAEDDRVWLSLRVECIEDEKRMSITYRPGYNYDLPSLPENMVTEALGSDEIPEGEELFAQIPLENAMAFAETDQIEAPREMVFFDFKSFGYTSVAYLGKHSDWKFFEPEPLSPVFSRLITGSFADISLLATGTVERLPLRGSGKALRPIVETCRKAKRKG